ncbi:MAG: septum formation family protein, partial [Streptosporangiales bacterium]
PGAGPPDGAAPGTVPVPRRTDGFAVATLITGILALIPVTVVLGPVALARVASSGARGRRLAVTGLVLAGAWLLAGGLAVAALVAHRPPSAPVSLPRIFAVHTGQCLNSAPNEMSGVNVVSCASAHDAEVFGTFQVAAHRYPGAPALRHDAGLGCASRLSGYLNPQLASTSLTESYVYPDSGAWAAGGRTVVCTIRSATGQLTGSVRTLPG